MAWTKFENFARTTLAAEIATAGATSATVTNIATFPTTFPFHVVIWDAATYPDPTNDTAGREIVQVMANPSGNVFTIVRAQGGTVAVAHTSGEAFCNTIIAEDMEALQVAAGVVSSKSTDFTADTAASIYLCDATGGNVTVTLPAAADNTHRTYTIKKVDSSANTVIIDGNASETIDGGLTATLTVQYEAVCIACDGSNWWVY